MVDVIPTSFWRAARSVKSLRAPGTQTVRLLVARAHPPDPHRTTRDRTSLFVLLDSPYE